MPYPSTGWGLSTSPGTTPGGTSANTGGEKPKGPVYQGKTVDEWVKALKNWDSRVRGEAATALGRIGPAAKAAIPALIDALKDRDPLVRVEAASALGSIGPDAIGALRDALKNEDRYVRMEPPWPWDTSAPRPGTPCPRYGRP
jgi:hypothetical protein